jgi:hypothetical protein
LEILKNAMTYVKTNHPDAAQFIDDSISFSESGGGRGQQGYTGVTYTGGGWTVNIGHAIVPETIYEIRADYGNGKILWVGVLKNGQIKEEGYKSN